MQIFEAFKKKYRGVAGSAKSTDWWETWEGYVGAWKRNDDKSARESGRGGRFSVTDHLSN